MDTKLYLTIAAIVLILWGLGFFLIPAELGATFGVPPEPHNIVTGRFLGSVLLGLGVITWFARDFRDWAAARGVLIGLVVVDVVGGIINIWATIQGLFNALAWGSTIVNVLLLLGALYFLFTGSRKAA